MYSYTSSFEKAMCDDMNTPRAIATLFKLVSESEKAAKSNILDHASASVLLLAIEKIDEVFGVLYEPPVSYFQQISVNAGAGVGAAAGTGSGGAVTGSVSSSEPRLLEESEIPANVSELLLSRLTLKADKQV